MRDSMEAGRLVTVTGPASNGGSPEAGTSEGSVSRAGGSLRRWKDEPRRRMLVKALFLAAATFCVLALRRPDQLSHPYLWDEDGTVNLPQYVALGWRSIFTPVNGYLILPPKLLFVLATKISFLHQPTVAYWLTVLFTWGVVTCIALSPTTLRFPTLCALAALLVPTDPEVFGVSLYTLWWATLLVFVPLLWRDDARPLTIVRVVMVLLGGLSSPLAIGTVPLFATRILRRRSWSNLFVFAASLVVAVLQLASVARAGLLSNAPGARLHVSDAYLLVTKFFGYFVYGSEATLPSTIAGALLLAFLVAAWFRSRRSIRLEHLFLFASLVLSIAASVQRAGLVMHPVLGGPRYFFFPFVLLSWILLELAAVGGALVRVAVALALVLALRETVSHGTRYHDAFGWEREVIACTQSADHTFPVHYDGVREKAWRVTLTGAQCRTLLAESLFGRAP